MQPRLTVQVLGDNSAPRIVDLCSKKSRPWKGKVKLKKLDLSECEEKLEDLSECEEKLEDHNASSPIKHLVAKKFASIVPKRNVQVPQIVAELKVIKLLRKSSRPKSLGISLDAKGQFNSQEKSTLDMLIPPSENFHGFNNPFSSQFKGTCSIKSNKLASSDCNVDDQNNNKKVKRKKVCVKGRMKMENGNMKYFAESKLPFSAKSTDKTVSEESSFDIHDQVQRSIDIIYEDILINDDESVTYATSFEKEDSVIVTDVDMLENNGDENNHIQDQMNTQVADQFLCDHCPAMFNSCESFEKHVKTNCGEPPEKVLLDECPTMLKSINDSEKYEESPLGGKLESHTRDRLTTQSLCDQCPTLWYSRENLKSHCDRMHTPNSRENFKSHCDRMYTPSSIHPLGSKTFENSTPGEMTKKVKCGFCSKSFKNKSILKIHVRGHCGKTELRCDKRKSGENVERFLCIICQRCFYDKRGLNLHKLVHSRKKSYRKSSRILAKNLDSGENNKRIVYSKTSTYKYRKEISEFYNKDEKLICAKSSKKYRKRVTTWRGKEKKNESTISVRKCKKTRMDVKMEKSDFMKNKRKSSTRTSELNERLTPKMKKSKGLLNKANDLGKNKDGHHDGIEIGKNDNPDKDLEIELIEITSYDEEKDPLMITIEDEDDIVPFNAEPELIQIDD